MNHNELIGTNMKFDLVSDIQGMDFTGCSNNDIIALRTWVSEVKERADFLTLEGEVVGYTYSNLNVLNPMISKEEEKRGMVLVKKIK